MRAKAALARRGQPDWASGHARRPGGLRGGWR